MSTTRKVLRNAIAVAAVVAAFAGPSVDAHAKGATAYQRFKGQIVVSDDQIRTDYTSDAALIASLGKANRAELRRDGTESPWTINFMGFLNKKPGPGSLYLVFYDTTGGRREYVSNKEIQIDIGGNIVVSTVEVSEEDGLKAGKRYEVVLGRRSGGRETVYAKTKLFLK